jgi:hypothetical protein
MTAASGTGERPARRLADPRHLASFAGGFFAFLVPGVLLWVAATAMGEARTTR